MNILILTLIFAVIGSVLSLAVLIAVIAGIHASERRMSLERKPCTRSEMVARRVLGVHPGQRNNSRSVMTGQRGAH